jgi:aspartyl-tRNA(Asn)/glutamyl-tRNA(Gln) amidotransferase subunit B
VLDILIQKGGEPEAIVEEEGLASAGGDELEAIVERAMAEQADAVEKIKQGNDKAVGAIMGAVMRETKGRADGGEVQRMINERIGAG